MSHAAEIIDLEQELETLVGEYVFNVVKGTQQFKVTDH